ncbi:MAG: hypothetical protein QGI24_01525 [Kiritimatiellia bacterium]|nr:hypothetical protein [Kiritimatiellia bacterium]MDP6847443.1 hypothetical protein [Kiritimatiellia bacterium]
MIKWITRLLLLVLVVMASGCIDSTTTVHVRKDGSGTVTETVYVTRTMERMMAMMIGMAVALSEDAEGKGSQATSVGKAHYENRAGKIGEDVSLVSFKKIKGRNGASGTKAVYAFKDVRKISVSVEPDYALPEAVKSSAATNSTSSAGASGVTFEFRKAPKCELAVSLPWAEKARANILPRTGSRSGTRIPLEEIGMLRHVLDGFRARMRITVDDIIADTDAQFVERGRADPQKKYVVLYDLNIGEAVKNEAQLDQMAAIGPVPDMAEALVVFAGIPGMKITRADKVKVSF